MTKNQAEEIEETIANLVRMVEKLKSQGITIQSDVMAKILSRIEILEGKLRSLDTSSVDMQKAMEEILPRFEKMEVDFGKCRAVCELGQVKRPSGKTKKLFSKLDKLAKKGSIAKAIDLAQEYRIEFKQDPTFWYYFGTLHLANDNPTEALNFFDKSVKLDPEMFEPHCSSVMALADLDRLDDAKSYIVNLIKSHPIPPCHGFYSFVGNILWRKGSVDDVNQIVESVTHPLKPGCTPCIKAFLYLSVKEGQKALDALKDVEGVKCPEYRLVRAAALGKAGHADDFVAEIESVKLKFEIDPMMYLVLTQAIKSFDSKSQCETLKTFAMKIMKKIKWRKVLEPKGRLLEAAAYKSYNLRCPDVDFRLRLLKEAAKHHDCPALRNNLIITLTDIGKPEEAKRTAREAIRKYPEDNDLLIGAAWVFSKVGERNLASKAVDDALKREKIAGDSDDLVRLAAIARNLQLGSYDSIVRSLYDIVEKEQPEMLESMRERFPMGEDEDIKASEP